jgi:hypothetical protein
MRTMEQLRNVISYLDQLAWVARPDASYAEDDCNVYRRVRAPNMTAWRYYHAIRDAVVGSWDPLNSAPIVVAWREPSWQAEGWRPVRWSDAAWCYTLPGCSAAIVEEIAPSGRPKYMLVARSTGAPAWGDLHWDFLTEAITSALAASAPNSDETKPFALAQPAA